MDQAEMSSPQNSSNDTTSLPPTDMIHMSYEGCFQLECFAKVLAVRQMVVNGATIAVDISLDRTTMHPQGGGQPSDVGVISSLENTTTTPIKRSVTITKVTMDRVSSVVTHSGVGDGCWEVGQVVHVAVTAETRRIHSECHTAGHVVDSAMARCHRILPAMKAYHFLDGPYVEYRGTIPIEERDTLVTDLQHAFLELVENDMPTQIQSMSRANAEEICHPESVDLSEYSDNDCIRIVTVAGWACPCGGTHVRSTADLKERKWNITGIKSKKGVVRIKYGQNVASLLPPIPKPIGSV
jgi:Ser-tRNA(Ala) deacylase AlaX